MDDATPYFSIGLIAAIALSLFISFWVVKAAVRSANRPLERYLKILAGMKARENRQAYNETMKEIELEELNQQKHRYNSQDLQKRKNEILTKYGA